MTEWTALKLMLLISGAQLVTLLRLYWLLSAARVSHEHSQIAIHKVLAALYETTLERGRLPPDVPRRDYGGPVRVDEQAFRRP